MLAVQLRHLRYFVTIVDAGSFSRAAASIHVAQPALSQQIAELEQILGVNLLLRSARGVRATPAGETFYREAASILRQMEQLPGKVRSTGGEVEGMVNLGVASTLAAVHAGPFMEACRAALPKVALRFFAGNSLLIRARIEAKSLDLGILFEDAPTPGVIRQPLFRQRLYLLGSARQVGRPISVSIGELAQRPLILTAHPNVSRIVVDRAFAAARVVPNIVAEADLLSSVLSAVQSGIGETILPKGDFSDVSGHADIVATPIEPATHLVASAITASDAPLTRAGNAVRDLFISVVRNWLVENHPPGAEWIGAEWIGDKAPHIEQR